MNQNIFGPHAWFILHSMTLAYPLEPTGKDKENQRRFLESFGQIMFCDICKVHYNRNLQENPPKLDTKKEFFEWMVDLHNEVNGRTGKRSWTYDEVLKLYEDHYKKDFVLINKGNNKESPRIFLRKIYCLWLQYHTYLIILFLLGIIIYLTQKYWKKYIN